MKNNNNKNKYQHNKLLSRPLEKAARKDEELPEMPVEGACSPEFQQGCLSMDDEL